jgi:hypothetical protein
MRRQNIVIEQPMDDFKKTYIKQLVKNISNYLLLHIRYIES